MNRLILLMQLLLLVFVAASCTVRLSPKEADAVANIKKLGGHFHTACLKKGCSDESVISVSLWGTAASNATLQELRALANLKILRLGDTKITDAGLENIEALRLLQDLSLDSVIDQHILTTEQAEKRVPNNEGKSRSK